MALCSAKSLLLISSQTARLAWLQWKQCPLINLTPLWTSSPRIPQSCGQSVLLFHDGARRVAERLISKHDAWMFPEGQGESNHRTLTFRAPDPQWIQSRNSGVFFFFPLFCFSSFLLTFLFFCPWLEGAGRLALGSALPRAYQGQGEGRGRSLLPGFPGL